MDRTLLYVGEHQTQPSEDLDIFFDTDYPVVFAKNGNDFRYFLDMLVGRGHLVRRGDSRNRDNQWYQTTPDGWEKIEHLNQVGINSDQAFVAMWFSDDMRQVYEDGFKSALNATGFDPVRVDLVQHNEKIDDRIMAEIRRSGLMVADLTGQRGGVYFEAGFARGLGIPVIWTCCKPEVEKLHFDIRQFNFIDWTTPEELKERLTYRIEATIPGRAIHR
jgi:nucleoside 2-deoxyribosyltransferase